MNILRMLPQVFFSFFMVLFIVLSTVSHVFAFEENINTKPEKYEDPFIPMRQKIEKFSQFIHEKEKSTKCENDWGKDLYAFYTLKNTPFLKKRAEKEVELGSATYNRNINEIDDATHRLVKEFAESEHACSSSSYITAKRMLSDIFIEREKLLQKTQNNTSSKNIYKKENANTDSGFFTFTETTHIFNNLLKKMDLIKKAAEDLTEGEISPEYDFRLTDSERKKITERSRERASAYADDFIEATKTYVYAPILRSSISIRKDLESLPDGRSEFDNYTYSLDFKKIVSDMLSPTAKVNASEHLEKNTTLNDTFRTPFTENAVVINKKIARENIWYREKLEKMMQLEETIAGNDEPFSKAVVDSLIPFHITLLETERLLNYQTNNLKFVLNRQNVEVE